MNFINLFFLLLGGIIGTLLRFKIINLPLFFGVLKINVLVVNILGSFIAGAFFLISKHYTIDYRYNLLFLVGFCGALTTMSSCVLESVLLVQEKGWFFGAVNLSLNVFLSVLAVWLGMFFVSLVLRYLG